MTPTHDHRRPPLTEAPARLDLTPSFLAWWNASDVVVLDLEAEEAAFLGHCRRQVIPNRDWLEAFKIWVLDAYRRWQRGQPCASYPHPGQRQGLNPRLAPLWAPWQAEGSESCGRRGHGGDHSPPALASSQLGEDARAEWAPSAQHPARASGPIRVSQGRDVRSGHHLEHLAKEAGPMGHGSNPPGG
jgi:hypothetical protein